MMIEMEYPEKKNMLILNKDGTLLESESPSDRDGIPLKRTARLKWLDRNSFETTIADDAVSETGEKRNILRTIRTTALSGDGKILTLNGAITFVPNNQNFTYTLLFEKK